MWRSWDTCAAGSPVLVINSWVFSEVRRQGVTRLVHARLPSWKQTDSRKELLQSRHRNSEDTIIEAEDATPKATDWLWGMNSCGNRVVPVAFCQFGPFIGENHPSSADFLRAFGWGWNRAGVICFKQAGARKAPLCHVQVAPIYMEPQQFVSFSR